MLISFAFALAITRATADSGIENVLNKMAAINSSQGLNVEQRMSHMSDLYRSSVTSSMQDLAHQSNRDLHMLFTIEDMASSYSQFTHQQLHLTYLRDLQHTYDELDRRREATEDEIQQLYRQLLGARLFDRAKKLYVAHYNIGLAAPPRIEIAPGFVRNEPAAYSLGRDGQSLVLQNVDIGGPYRIVVVAQCHIARDAANAIANDPQLSEGLRQGHVIWIEGSGEELTPISLNEWNSSFPGKPLSIAYDNDTWKGVDFSASPQFFLFKNGVLVSELKGWSPKAGKQQLATWLRLGGVVH